jgi:predicted CXXCH cytochrome family protein
MSNMQKIRLLFIASLVPIIVWIVFASEKERELKIVFPQDRSILTNPHVTVICKLNEDAKDKPHTLPNLTVNGMTHKWRKEYLPTILVAGVKLQEGLNWLQIGDAKVSVYVVGEKAKTPPADWKEIRSHPLSVEKEPTCSTCHTLTKGIGTPHLGEVQLPKACDACHSEIEFELKHNHPKRSIEHCTICHSIHGSTMSSLLKRTPKELCKSCHD